MIDANPILSPASAVPPCGPDIDDDAVCAAEPLAARQRGELSLLAGLCRDAPRDNEVVSKGSDDSPEWVEIIERSARFLESNKHLQAAVFLCEAATRLHQLSGLSQSLKLIRTMCEEWWNELHPLASNPAGRQNRADALGEIASRNLLMALRNMPFVEGHSAATLRNFEAMVASEGSTTNEFAPRFVSAVLGDATSEQITEALRLIDEALENIGWISDKINSDVGTSGDVECSEILNNIEARLVKNLETIRRILMPEGGTSSSAIDATSQSTADSREEPANVESPQPAGTATDALSKIRIHQMLDHIIAYYREREPSSPVPLLLHRAKRLMDLGFIDLVKDTAGEDAVRRAREILGDMKDE